MFDFAADQPRRRMSLTPMVDVVFLLLVFFMLVARFGLEQAVPVTLGGAGQSYEGPPRLIDVSPTGLRLNGVARPERDLLVELVGLTESGEDIVVLRPEGGASLQRLVDVIALLERAGFSTVAVVEAAK